MSTIVMFASAVAFTFSGLAYNPENPYGSYMFLGASLFFMLFSIRIKMDKK